MEIREGNIIVNVDKILDADKTKFVGVMGRMINLIVEETNMEILSLAMESIARASMVIRVAKEMIGGPNE